MLSGREAASSRTLMCGVVSSACCGLLAQSVRAPRTTLSEGTSRCMASLQPSTRNDHVLQSPPHDSTALASNSSVRFLDRKVAWNNLIMSFRGLAKCRGRTPELVSLHISQNCGRCTSFCCQDTLGRAWPLSSILRHVPSHQSA